MNRNGAFSDGVQQAGQSQSPTYHASTVPVIKQLHPTGVTGFHFKVPCGPATNICQKHSGICHPFPPDFLPVSKLSFNFYFPHILIVLFTFEV